MIFFEKPYPHIKWFDFLPVAEYRAMLNSLESLEWENYNKNSYRYKVSSIDETSAFAIQNKDSIYKFISSGFIDKLSAQLSVGLTRCSDFTFHKMSIGDYSFKHTDKNDFGELARVVFYLSSPRQYEGGNLLLYQDDGRIVYEKLSMPANSFWGFRLTDNFFHEVEIITKGERYCISITYS